MIVRGGRPGCFAKVYPRPALSYEEWLDRLRRDGHAWVVLSRLGDIGEQSAMEEVLADLQELGSLRVWPVRGDVDVLFWERSRGDLQAPPAGADKNPCSAELAELENTDTGMAIVDHFTGDPRLVDYSVRFTENGGTLWLTPMRWGGCLAGSSSMCGIGYSEGERFPELSR